MPCGGRKLTAHGQRMKRRLRSEYGNDRVFYAMTQSRGHGGRGKIGRKRIRR